MLVMLLHGLRVAELTHTNIYFHMHTYIQYFRYILKFPIHDTIKLDRREHP